MTKGVWSANCRTYFSNVEAVSVVQAVPLSASEPMIPPSNHSMAALQDVARVFLVSVVLSSKMGVSRIWLIDKPSDLSHAWTVGWTTCRHPHPYLWRYRFDAREIVQRPPLSAIQSRSVLPSWLHTAVKQVQEVRSGSTLPFPLPQDWSRMPSILPNTGKSL